MPSTATSRLSPSSRSTRSRTRPAGDGGQAASASGPAEAPDKVDTSFLETLLGYNARRTALAVISVFLQRMAPYDLRPVDFSVLSVIAHNPGVTSRQICAALDILPPNLVGMIKSLERRGLIERRPHPTDRRAQGLHLTPAGHRLQKDAEATASALESEVADRLTATELQTLIRLLRKVYLP
ncbi:MAG: MarR family transcriptional regulator [Burkholderiales bacterium]|nr:MAG: MarR family transcriptional regulator [Burkholderiales bacterium]